MFVADVVAEKARHGAHGPWMTVRFISWAIERHFAGIQADAGPRLAQAGVDVFFAGHEIDRAGLGFVRQDKIHQRVFGRFLPRFGNLIESFSGKLFEIRILG